MERRDAGKRAALATLIAALTSQESPASTKSPSSLPPDAPSTTVQPTELGTSSQEIQP